MVRQSVGRSDTECEVHSGALEFQALKERRQNEKVRKAYGLASMVAVVGLCCLITGVILISRRTNSPSGEIPYPPVTSSAQNASQTVVDPCAFSVEAKRAGLPEFFRKIKKSYLKSFPFISLYMSYMTAEERKQAYGPFMPTAANLRAITDSSIALEMELENIKIDARRLKLRERKLLAQAKHFLRYHYGSPYLDNYYAGAWMLGPSRQCTREGIAYVRLQVATMFLLFQPKTGNDLEDVLKSLKATGRGVAQYENNIRRGILSGMVRSKEECNAGLQCMQSLYPVISETGSGKAILHWIYSSGYMFNMTRYISVLQRNTTVVREWRRVHNSTIVQSLEETLIRDIGAPLVKLLSYLRHVHPLYCLPKGVISGMASRPVPYVYYNGIRTNNRTRQYLPDGEIVGGASTYEMVLAYYTTLPYSAEKVHQMGWEMVRKLYKQTVEMARNITGLKNETQAVEQFRKYINKPEMFFNQEPFPANESDERAYRICRSVENARRFCPVRYATMQQWFKVARQSLTLLEPKFISLFHHGVGPKKTTPVCPVGLGISFDPTVGVQSYIPSESWCPSPAKYQMPFFVDRMGPKYTEWAVSAHEARPGHHLQVQGYLENFRDLCESSVDLLDNQHYTAFTEGWAMYAESPITALDTDIFQGHPLEWYGMIKAQLWRALRLVVDTGLHYKRMTRDEAIALFNQYLWDNSDVVEKEITRYQSWPGQASTYMTGQIALWDMRKRAQQRLGEKFSMKDFHYHVLSHGQVPLTFIKEHVDHYVDCVLGKTRKGCQDILVHYKLPAAKAFSRQWAKIEMDLKRRWRLRNTLSQFEVYEF